MRRAATALGALFVAACGGPTPPPEPPASAQAPALLISYEEGGDRVEFIAPATTRITREGGATCENELPEGGNMYSGREVEDAFSHADVQRALLGDATYAGEVDAVLKAPSRPGSITWRSTCTSCAAAPPGVSRLYTVMEVVMRNRRLLCP